MKSSESASSVGKRFALVSIIILMTAFIPAQASQISIDPECQIISMGEYFTVNISVDPEGNETYAASYTLYFNTTLLNASSPVNGSFLSQDGAQTWQTRNITDNTNGTIEYGECRKSVQYGVTNPGVLTAVTFEAIADGFCELGLGKLDGVILADPNFTAISTVVNNGSVRIGLCGNANTDESVDLGDVLDVFDHFMYSFPLSNEWAADVNNDYNIDLGDALDIFDHFMHGKDLNCRCEA